MIPEIEYKDLQEQKAFQETKLAELLAYLQTNSTFYKRLFREKKISISKVKTLEDLANLPVTTKEDIFHSNEDFICVSKDDIIDHVTTSGTLGEPVIFPLTNKDLDRLAYNEYISFLSWHA